MKKRLGITRGEPSSEIREALDKMYNENKERVRLAGMSRHDFRKFAFGILQERWREWIADSNLELEAFMSLLNFGDMTADSHRKVLSQSFEPEERAAALSSLTWHVCEWSKPTLILPDSISLAHDPSAGAAPLAFVSNNDLRGAIFPLSPTRAICAGTYGNSSVLETLARGFPTLAAMCSWNFVVMSPSFGYNDDVASRLGHTVAEMIVGVIEDGITKSLNEAF